MPSQFQILKSDQSQHRLVEVAAPEIGEGEALLTVRQFALTANNVTYAQAAELFKYWDFFPASDPNWGLMPVWGFAEVSQSRVPELAVGTLVYGYLPPATHLRVQPEAFRSGHFVDASPHRAHLAKVYNQYRLIDAMDPRAPLLEPLFATSWTLRGYAQSRDWFDAQQVLILSASGKTSLGLAHSLQGVIPTIGLTSKGNAAFVQSTGLYDQVATYDDISALAQDTPTLIIDMSGNAALIDQLSQHLDDKLKYVIKVGLSHWSSAKGLGKVAADRAETFFAPSYIAEFTKANGSAALAKEMAAFLSGAFAASQEWIAIKQLEGLGKIQGAYNSIRAGHQNPAEGVVISLPSPI